MRFLKKFVSVEWVSSLVSLQTSLLEKKLQKPASAKTSRESTCDTVKAAEDRHESNEFENREAVSKDQKDECEKTGIRADNDDVERTDCEEKACVKRDEGVGNKEIVQKIGEENSDETKVTAPHASPGSSTISGETPDCVLS
jgi:hypothetical protein